MKKNLKNTISSLIKDINKAYPNIPFGTHLLLATSDYSNLASITDKEFIYLLEKYIAERELDILIPHQSDESLEIFIGETDFEEDEF